MGFLAIKGLKRPDLILSFMAGSGHDSKEHLCHQLLCVTVRKSNLRWGQILASLVNTKQQQTYMWALLVIKKGILHAFMVRSDTSTNLYKILWHMFLFASFMKFGSKMKIIVCLQAFGYKYEGTFSCHSNQSSKPIYHI